MDTPGEVGGQHLQDTQPGKIWSQVRGGHKVCGQVKGSQVKGGQVKGSHKMCGQVRGGQVRGDHTLGKEHTSRERSGHEVHSLVKMGGDIHYIDITIFATSAILFTT